MHIDSSSVGYGKICIDTVAASFVENVITWLLSLALTGPDPKMSRLVFLNLINWSVYVVMMNTESLIYINSHN